MIPTIHCVAGVVSLAMENFEFFFGEASLSKQPIEASLNGTVVGDNEGNIIQEKIIQEKEKDKESSTTGSENGVQSEDESISEGNGEEVSSSNFEKQDEISNKQEILDKDISSSETISPKEEKEETSKKEKQTKKVKHKKHQKEETRKSIEISLGDGISTITVTEPSRTKKSKKEKKEKHSHKEKSKEKSTEKKNQAVEIVTTDS